MSHQDNFSPEPGAGHIAQTAAEWVLRLDRGLTAAEQDAYTHWLAADPSHRAALAEARWGWDELDRLAGIQDSVHAIPDPDLLRQPRRGFRRNPWWLGALAMAAAAMLTVILWMRPTDFVPADAARAPSHALAAPIEERTLEDGTVVALNHGALIEVAFAPGERRVRLVRGEANFKVMKNPQRPFIVRAEGVKVRAVGTAFIVRLDPKSVEVLVTEGKVQVTPPVAGPAAPATVPLVEAGQRTVVSLDPAAPAPRVVAVDAGEMSRAISWQPRLLDFNDQPLAEIVAEFNRRNAVRIVVPDPEFGALRLSASFRSDNVEGFIRLMGSDFGLRAEWRGETEIVLRHK